MLKIGILGVGSIGQSLATALDQKRIDAELVALSDQDREKAEAVSASLSSHPPVVPVAELIEHRGQPRRQWPVFGSVGGGG